MHAHVSISCTTPNQQAIYTNYEQWNWNQQPNPEHVAAVPSESSEGQQQGNRPGNQTSNQCVPRARSPRIQGTKRPLDSDGAAAALAATRISRGPARATRGVMRAGAGATPEVRLNVKNRTARAIKQRSSLPRKLVSGHFHFYRGLFPSPVPLKFRILHAFTVS